MAGGAECVVVVYIHLDADALVSARLSQQPLLSAPSPAWPS